MNYQRRDDGYYWIDENGNDVGQINWEEDSDGDLILTHTYVSDVLRGQGAAMKLLVKAVEYAKQSGKKITPVCPYAVERIEEVNGAVNILK